MHKLTVETTLYFMDIMLSLNVSGQCVLRNDKMISSFDFSNSEIATETSNRDKPKYCNVFKHVRLMKKYYAQSLQIGIFCIQQ